MKKIIYRKNHLFGSKKAVESALNAMDEFVLGADPGQSPPQLDSVLRQIWNHGGERLKWGWSEESEVESIRKKAEENNEKAEKQRLKDDNEYFKNAKLRAWRNSKLALWVDETFIKPLKFKLSVEQEEERKEKREELLNWPNMVEFESYKMDDEIESLKPSPPSWITE